MFLYIVPIKKLFKFSTLESTIAKVIVKSCALIWNKMVNWNDMEEHIQFQLEALPIKDIIVDDFNINSKTIKFYN